MRTTLRRLARSSALILQCLLKANVLLTEGSVPLVLLLRLVRLLVTLGIRAVHFSLIWLPYEAAI